MSIIYAIPSRGRAAVVGDKTIASLVAAGVDRADIHLWVDEDEADAYQMHEKSVGEFHVGPKRTTLRDKRNNLTLHYPKGQRLVSCDDDVSAYWYAKTRKRPLTPLKDLPRLAEWAFDTADSLGIGLWGLYPIDNPFFMRPYATTDLRFIPGPTLGYTTTGDDTERGTVDEKDDIERSIRFAIRDGGVLRINWASFSTSYYTEEGGMQLYRTDESITEGALRLAAMYPQFVRLRRRSNHRGTAEVDLVRGYAVCPPIPAPEEWM